MADVFITKTFPALDNHSIDYASVQGGVTMFTGDNVVQN
jgi:hypothetical protein